MIDSALGFERAFNRLDEHDPSFKNECRAVDSMDEIDWGKRRSLHSFLEQFYALANRLSGSHYISSHTYFDEISNVKILLMRALNGNDIDRRTMATKMNEKFVKYCDFENLNPIFLVAVVLDPRNKMGYVEIWYEELLKHDPFLFEESKMLKIEKFMEKLKTFMSRLYGHYKEEVTKFVDLEATKVMSGISNESIEKEKGCENLRDEIRAKLKRKGQSDVLNDLDK